MTIAIKSFRRYCLLQAYDAAVRLDVGTASALRGKQIAEPGTPLDASWPGYAQLVAAYYTTREDLDGADAAELMKIAGLPRVIAIAAIARLDT